MYIIFLLASCSSLSYYPTIGAMILATCPSQISRIVDPFSQPVFEVKFIMIVPAMSAGDVVAPARKSRPSTATEWLTSASDGICGCIGMDGTGGLCIFCINNNAFCVIAHPGGHSKQENQLLSVLIHKMLFLFRSLETPGSYSSS